MSMQSNFFTIKTILLISISIFIHLGTAGSAVAKTANDPKGNEYPNREHQENCLNQEQTRPYYNRTFAYANSTELSGDYFGANNNGYTTNPVNAEKFTISKQGQSIDTKSSVVSFRAEDRTLYRDDWIDTLGKSTIVFQCYYKLESGDRGSLPLEVGAQSRSLNNLSLNYDSRTYNTWLSFDTKVAGSDAKFICEVNYYNKGHRKWFYAKTLQLTSIIDAFNSVGILEDPICMTINTGDLQEEPYESTVVL